MVVPVFDLSKHICSEHFCSQYDIVIEICPCFYSTHLECTVIEEISFKDTRTRHVSIDGGACFLTLVNIFAQNIFVLNIRHSDCNVPLFLFYTFLMYRFGENKSVLKITNLRHVFFSIVLGRCDATQVSSDLSTDT